MRAAVAVTLCCSVFAGCRRASPPSPAPGALYAATFGVPESQVVAAPAPRADAVAGRDIDDRLAELIARFDEGSEPLTRTTYGSLGSGAAARYAVPVVTGRCYRVFVVGDQRAVDVDAQLRESPGAPPIESDESYGNVAVLGLRTALCPTRSGVYELSVRAQFREASYGIAVLSRAGGPSWERGQPQRSYVR